MGTILAFRAASVTKKWRPDDVYQCIFLPEDECDGKLLSRRSVSREMVRGRHMPAQPSVLLQPGYTPESQLPLGLAILSSFAVDKAFCSHFTMRLTRTRGTCHASTVLEFTYVVRPPWSCNTME